MSSAAERPTSRDGSVTSADGDCRNASAAPGTHLVQHWKSTDDGRHAIAICNQSAVTVGHLVPIGKRLAADAQIIAAMTRWRDQFRDSFFSQFTPTQDRTARWLQSYLTKDSRLLFLISNPDGQPIGNVGLCEIQDKSAELDNVVRAEPTSVPRMGFLATKALLDWWFAAVPASRLSLRVFADNQRAIAMYDALGFRRQSLQPVTAETVMDEIHYRPTTLSETTAATRSWLAMSLDAPPRGAVSLDAPLRGAVSLDAPPCVAPAPVASAGLPLARPIAPHVEIATGVRTTAAARH